MPRGKRKIEHVKTAEITVGSITVQVSNELRDTINVMRAKIADFSDAFAVVTQRKQDIAEAFMDGYTLWAKETSRSFVDYVRALDASIPADREGYRNHKTYQACDYLRRSVTVGRGGNRVGGAQAQPTRTNAVGRIARLLATVLTIVKEDDQPIIWQALSDELALTPRQVSNLKEMVSKTQPLFSFPIKRKVAAEVIHIADHAAKAA